MMKTFDIASLIRPNIQSLQPYRSARDEFRGKASLYLDANENPFPSPYHRYPDGQQQKLRKAVSNLKNTTPEQTLLTNGSDEAIDLLLRAFCRPQIDNIVIPQPTYGMYETCAHINDLTVRKPPLTPTFQLDVEAIQQVVDNQTKIIFLCSPNNPSGNLLRISAIRALLHSFRGIVVIDEAYIDFAGSKSWAEELKRHPNLVVLQTFSKAWGLAGIRVGICFANPEVIRVLEKIKPPYNVSSAAEETILQHIRSGRRRKDKQASVLVSERNKLTKSLKNLTIVKKVYPSDSNFLLVRVTDAAAIYKALLRRGIVVRLRAESLHCQNCIRITVGTPAQNTQLLTTLKSL